MPNSIPSSVALVSTRGAEPFAQSQMAAGAFLARYSGRTLETYRYDLRTFFQWCSDVGLDVLQATRAHIELWRSAMQERGWLPRPSTGGCRQSAASTASPTSTVGLLRIRRSTLANLRSTRARGEASTGASSAGSSSPPSAATPTMPPWPPYWV